MSVTRAATWRSLCMQKNLIHVPACKSSVGTVKHKVVRRGCTPKRALALFISVSALLNSSASGGIYHSDDRLQKPRAGQYAAIGLIVSTDRKAGVGTGFLVDPCHVLTAQHVEIHAEEVPATPPKVYFFYGTGPYKGFEKPVSGYAIRQGGYPPHYLMDNNKRDWVLVKLNECVGARVGYLKISPKNAVGALEKVKLSIAGYPKGRDWTSGLWVDPSCRIKGARDGTWLHDCASDEGNSGGPVFFITQGLNGAVFHVVGLHQSGMSLPFVMKEWNEHNSNVAVRLNAIYESIKDVIKP